MDLLPSLVYGPIAGPLSALAAQRQQRIDAFKAGALLAAPAYQTATGYTRGQVVTVPSGPLIYADVAGTSGGVAPAYSASALIGRPFVDNGVTWYGVYQKNAAASAEPLPTLTSGVNAAAVGLTETILSNSSGISPLVTVIGAVPSNGGSSNGLAGVGFATAPAAGPAGNATMQAIALGYSADYQYAALTWEFEIIINDSVVGITFAAVTGNVAIEVDGQLVNADPVRITNNAGFCIKIDYAGKLGRRKVRISSSFAFFIRGIAMTPSGYAEVSDTPNDTALILGDSLGLTSSTTFGSINQPIALLSSMITRYLGIAGIINMSVGSSGYLAFPAGGYTTGQVVNNPVNRQLIRAYNPPHVFIFSGHNDSAGPPSAVVNAALATWQALRALLPTAKITILDGLAQASSANAGLIANAAALYSMWQLWGDTNSRFIQSTGAGGKASWIFGTGNAGTAIVVGNSSAYVGPDGTHSTPRGINYTAQRWAGATSLAWNGDY